MKPTKINKYIQSEVKYFFTVIVKSLTLVMENFVSYRETNRFSLLGNLFKKNDNKIYA